MKKENKAGKPVTGTQELMTQILGSIGSPVFVKDRKHRWIYLNKAFCEFMGRPKDEVLGKSDHDFFPKEQADIFWEKDDQVFSSGGENINEEFFTDAAGNRHIIITRKQVFKDEAGGEVLVGVINDITGIRKANDDLALFRKLLESSNDAIFIVNPEDGSFLDVNDTACRRLGYPRKTMLRMGVGDIQAAAAGPGGWEKLKSRITASESALIEGRHVRADGTSFPVEVGINYTDIGGRKYILASARDITDRKKLEEAVKEADTLRGLIPMCAKCKKIRDDKGFWEKVEIYLEKHSEARFTHGLCKECMKELYGKESWFKETK